MPRFALIYIHIPPRNYTHANTPCSQAAISRYTDTLNTFTHDLTTLSNTLTSLPSTLTTKPSILHPSQNPVPRSLSELDHHTVALVDSFEKLNHHYAQCVDALCRTNTGAAELHNSTILGLSQTLATGGVAEPPLDTAPLLQSLSPSEFELLSTDSSTVPDVLDDMNHSLNTMDQIYTTDVLGHLDALDAVAVDTHTALAKFEDFQASLGGYVVAGTEFEAAQKEFQALMHPALERLRALAEFYAEIGRAHV